MEKTTPLISFISAITSGVYSANRLMVEKALTGLSPPPYRVEGEPISAIICTHNEEEYIGNCITCLLNQTYPPAEIIVVDYESEDRTKKIAWSLGAKIIETNVPGVGNARDLGAEKSSFKYLFFTDADTIMENKIIEELAKTLEKGCDVVSVPPVYYDTKNPFLIFGINLHRFRAPWDISGRATLIPKEVWRNVDGWELPIWEERHFGLKLKNAGYNIEMRRDLAVATTARRWWGESRALRLPHMIEMEVEKKF